MFEVRIVEKPAFAMIGRKAWVPLNLPDDFCRLWREAHESGLIKKLMALGGGAPGAQTNAAFLGVARGTLGGLDYWIAAEALVNAHDDELDRFEAPASRWALIASEGASLEEISKLEHYAYEDWLPKSGYMLTDAPQMNAFLADGDHEYTELWLPIMKKTGGVTMKIRPYLTYNGQCSEAIELYKRAFNTDVLQVMRFSDMPPNPDFQIPADFMNRVVQCTLKMGDDFIRMSDCGPGQPLNDPESERISLAVETSIEEVKHAFAVLAEEGRVGMDLAETFYSPLAGVVFDKFGVMWNFVAQK